MKQKHVRCLSSTRKHFKTEWHNFNAKLSAQSKESLSADEYDEYILMHPEALK